MFGIFFKISKNIFYKGVYNVWIKKSVLLEIEFLLLKKGKEEILKIFIETMETGSMLSLFELNQIIMKTANAGHPMSCFRWKRTKEI